MVQSRHQSIDELIAYIRGELDDLRQTEVEAHLRTCPECWHNVWLLRKLRRSLNERYPLVDNPAAQANIMQRVRESAGARDQALIKPDHQRKPARIPLAASYWRSALLLAVVLTFFGVLLAPHESWADFPLARYIGFADKGEIEHSDTEVETGAASVASQFDLVSPLSLAGGFHLVEQELIDSDRTQLQYRRGDGLLIRVTEARAAASHTIIERDEYERLRVQNTHVLLLWQPKIESVAHLIWLHNGVVFNVFVDSMTPSMQLERSEAIQLVEAFIAAQNGS